MNGTTIKLSTIIDTRTLEKKLLVGNKVGKNKQTNKTIEKSIHPEYWDRLDFTNSVKVSQTGQHKQNGMTAHVGCIYYF